MPLAPGALHSQPGPNGAAQSWAGQGLSVKASAFVLATMSIGLGLVAWELGQSDWRQTGALALAALASAAQLVKAEGRSPRTRYSLAWFAYGFALVVLGWSGALFVMVTAHVVEWVWYRYRWYVQGFNIGANALAVGAAGLALAWAGGQRLPLDWRLAAAGLLALAIFTLVNHLLVGVAIWLTSGANLAQSGVFSRLGLGIDLSLLGLGAGAAVMWTIHPALAVFNLLPLYLMYRTLRVPALERKSECDPKTGLYNTAYFDEVLAGQLGRVRRGGRPFTVVMADLDRLRDVNNAFGHLAGDAVLRGVAAVLTQALPPAAVTARFGGEEFAILLPDTRAEQAYPLVEAVRKAVESQAYLVPGGISTVNVTMSFGLAGSSEPCETPNDLLNNADTALYAAKRAGRNQVCIYSATPYQALFDAHVR